jgi:hypothetical protein
MRLFDVTVPAPGAYYALFMPGSRARPEGRCFHQLVSVDLPENLTVRLA